MALELNLENDSLVLTVTGMEHVWLGAGTVEIPLAQVTDAEARPLDSVVMPHRKVYGERLSDKRASGRFEGDDGEELWDVHGGKEVLVVDLSRAKYARLVLQVADPESWASKLKAT